MVFLAYLFWRLLIDEEGKQIRLTAGELAQLWMQYLNDNANICIG